MVSGYFSGSTSTSASASGVTQPAQTLTRGKTAASSRSGRRPTRARRHAAVLPPGPPPTTMTSWITSASPEIHEEPEPVASGRADLFDRVGDLHGREEVALEVEVAGHVGFGEVVRGRIAHEPEERLRAMHDDRAHGLTVPEGHARPVPEAERPTGRGLTEDPAKHVSG